jgi:hypothetical protein
MRLHDFTVPDAPIPVDPQVIQRNAKASAAIVDWKGTKIFVTDAARSQDPFRAIARANRSPARPSSNRNYARDEAYVSRWLAEDLPLTEALDVIETKLANKQRDSSTRPWWATIWHYCRKLPAGSCVRDANATVLASLMRELEENLL